MNGTVRRVGRWVLRVWWWDGELYHRWGGLAHDGWVGCVRVAGREVSECPAMRVRGLYGVGGYGEGRGTRHGGEGRRWGRGYLHG